MKTSVVAIFSGRLVVSELGIAEDLPQHEVEEGDGDSRQVGQHDDGRRDQPPIQPIHGPNAREAQVKEVPASGMALFSSR